MGRFVALSTTSSSARPPASGAGGSDAAHVHQLHRSREHHAACGRQAPHDASGIYRIALYEERDQRAGVCISCHTTSLRGRMAWWIARAKHGCGMRPFETDHWSRYREEPASPTRTVHSASL